MDAVIAAGGIPQPQDPLYRYTNGGSKALIDVAGKPMVQWVLDALGEAKTIDRIVVVGLSEKAQLKSRKPLAYLSNEGRILDNLKAGTARVLELNPKAEYVLFVSSDIPAITGEMVDWVVKTCMQTRDDLYYNVIRREAMETRFPTSRRTYTPLKDMQVCGGDMNMARTAIVTKNSEFWNKLLDARKNPAAQAALIGPDIIIRFLFRSLTIDDVIKRLADKLGLKGRALMCPYPEVGMDVDKPHQLEILRSHLGRRRRPGSSQAKSPRKKASAKARRKSSAAASAGPRRVTSRSRSRGKKR